MIKKIKDNLKYIKLEDIISFFIFILVLLPSLLFKIFNKIRGKKLWLVCERKTTASDNGYHFYKYIRTKHPKDYCFYVIDKKSNDYNKVKDLGNIIQWGSLKHWIYYLAASLNISTQKNGNPNAPLFYVLHVILGLYNNRVFLQHGITKDDAEWLYYKNTKFKYFICGAKREYEYIKERFGYPSGNVIYTGFSRFDNLYNNKVNKKQILVMPTWRNWLGRETNTLEKKNEFINTYYFKCWNSFLNNKKLNDYIKKNNIKLYFHPHFNMQKYITDFEINSKNIKIVDNNNSDIQDLLKKSSLMITDFSSVYMDFAYMKKPIIYYQFDKEEYREKQYQEGYFDYDKDGFGEVLLQVDNVVNKIINYVENDYKVEAKYLDRMNDFFELHDKKNCERIYNKIKE